MDLNIFDVFLLIEIIFIIDAQIVPSPDFSVWLLSHFNTTVVVFDSYLPFGCDIQTYHLHFLP